MEAACGAENFGMTDNPMLDAPMPEASSVDLPARAASMDEVLRDDACSFEFFQAVALLQRLRFKDREAVGQFSNPEDEAVHFRVNNTLAFPASQIQSIEDQKHGPPKMKVNFMGLTGPNGVLPYAYTEMMLELLLAKDPAVAAFLDI